MKASAIQPSTNVRTTGSKAVDGLKGRHLAFFAAITAVFLTHFAFVQPWYSHWGATSYEQSRVLPGDQFVTNGTQATHAITINAPSSLVWKWVAQLGQDRGGFYSYDLLENMVGCKMPTVDFLRPDEQSWKSGDRLWMYPPAYGIEVSGAPLQTYIPGKVLGFATTQNTIGDSSWTFFVDPISASQTRLLIRSRAAYETSVLHKVFNALFFDQAHFAMERRMMIGIKQMSEGEDRGRGWNHALVMLWIATIGLWILSIVFVFRRKRWLRPLVGFVAASSLFQFLTLVQPSVWIGSLCVIGLALLLWRSRVSAIEAAKAMA